MFVVRFITKFDESLPHYQKSSVQVLQSAPGELGSGAANRSMNPKLICPPYILWPRRVRAGSDLSSLDPQPVIARLQPSSPTAQPIVARSQSSSRNLRRRRPSSTRCRPTLYPSSPVFFKLPYPSSRIADPSSQAVDPSSRAASRCRVLQTRRRALWTRRRVLRTHRRDPSRAHPAPVRVRLISTRAFYYFPALCQSIPTCTCHGNCLRDSLKGALHFSSHVIHHD